MAPLVYVCCRWEMKKNGQGRFSFRRPGLPRESAQADGGLPGTYRVRMGSGDTEYYERSEWLLIPLVLRHGASGSGKTLSPP